MSSGPAMVSPDSSFSRFPLFGLGPTPQAASAARALAGDARTDAIITVVMAAAVPRRTNALLLILSPHRCGGPPGPENDNARGATCLLIYPQAGGPRPMVCGP